MDLLEEYTNLDKDYLDIESKKYEVKKANQSIFDIIHGLDKQQAEITSKKEQLKDQLLKAMEEKNIKKFENDYLSITYVAPSTRKNVDMDKLKAEYAPVYEDCLKETQVKPSIRIKLNNEF